MPLNCSICDVYLAETFEQLLGHIRRCHQSDPNFHCMCGLDGCTRTFRKYDSWRKHIFRKHKHVNGGDDAIQCNDDQLNEEDEQHEIVDAQAKTKRLEALYLLKLQEDCRLPIATVDSTLANTNSFIEWEQDIWSTGTNQVLFTKWWH